MIKFLILMTFLSFASDTPPKPEGKDGDKNSRAAIYSKHENDLNTLASKITTNETKIKELIAEKNKTNDKPKLKEIVAEIRKNLDERRDSIQKYNKEYHFMKYELPHKGKEFTKKYKRFDEKMQKSFEDEVNMQLSDVLGKLNKKYN